MTKYTLKIDGMMCGMCESHINDTIRKAAAVKKASSSHTKGETVIISENELDENKLREVIGGTGYELKSLTSAPEEEKKGLFGMFRKK